jgi:hypothetical protein
MSAIITSLGDLWQKITDIFYMVYGYLSTLADNIDSVSFTSDNTFVSWFGVLRYLVGDTVYMFLVTIITIGASFLLYKLFKKAFNFIIGFIPGIKGGSI